MITKLLSPRTAMSLSGAFVASWLLIVPGNQGRTAPLKTWITAGRYVSEDACLYERKIHLSGAHNMVINPGEQAKEETQEIEITDSSMCISDDDPRLK